MSAELKPDDVKKLWQEQPVEGKTMSLNEVHQKMEKLKRIVRRRNLIGGFASITVLLVFSYFVSTAENAMERVGAALTAAGAGYILYQVVMRKIQPRRGAWETQAEAGVAFYRAELQRQHDFHSGAWLWSRIAVFTPGPLIFCAGLASANPASKQIVLLEAVAVVVLLGIGIVRNRKVARVFQKELDEIDRVAC